MCRNRSRRSPALGLRAAAVTAAAAQRGSRRYGRPSRGMLTILKLDAASYESHSGRGTREHERRGARALVQVRWQQRRPEIDDRRADQHLARAGGRRSVGDRRERSRQAPAADGDH